MSHTTIKLCWKVCWKVCWDFNKAIELSPWPRIMRTVAARVASTPPSDDDDDDVITFSLCYALSVCNVTPAARSSLVQPQIWDFSSHFSPFFLCFHFQYIFFNFRVLFTSETGLVALATAAKGFWNSRLGAADCRHISCPDSNLVNIPLAWNRTLQKSKQFS